MYRIARPDAGHPLLGVSGALFRALLWCKAGNVSRFGSKIKVCAVGLACRSDDLSTAA
jgi:hypothetical protein